MMRARGQDGERVAKRLVLSLKFATETGAALCFSRMISGFRFVNAGVVSVKFCKSGSVVRGFGEIKRFMGRV